MVLELEPHQAHLWYFLLNGRTTIWLLQDFESIVSSAELDHSAKYSTSQARESYLINRVFARTILSQYCEVNPQSWDFQFNSLGKPEVAAPVAWQSLRFNLSNTDGLVTCAVALGRDIGVDAEPTNGPIEAAEVAVQYFSPSETAALGALSAEDRQCRFYELWTLKEAYLKARGLGLSVPLDKFTFECDGKAPIEIVFDASLVDDPKNWYFSLLRPVKSHIIAVALARLEAEEPKSWRAAVELITRPYKQLARRSGA